MQASKQRITRRDEFLEECAVPYALTVAGLGMNLIGAMVIAGAESYSSAAVEFSIMLLEKNIRRIRDIYEKKEEYRGFDEPADELRRIDAKSSDKVKLAGWIIVIGGYVLQIIAAIIFWTQAER